MKKRLIMVVAAFVSSLTSVVAEVTYTWTGGGDGVTMSQPANWGVSALDLAGGNNFIMSGLNPATLVLDADIVANSFTFGELKSDVVRITQDGSGHGSLTIGAGGISAASMRRYWQLVVPVAVDGDQSWKLGAGEIYISGVSGGFTDADPQNPATITISGGGTLYLGHADSTFSGTIVVEGGRLSLSDANPVGADAKVALKNTGNNSYLELKSNSTTPCDIAATLHTGNAGFDNAMITCWGNRHNHVVSGHVAYDGDLNRFLVSGGNDGAVITFTGGLTGAIGTRVGFRAGGSSAAGKIIIRGKPWISSGYLFNASSNADKNGNYPEVVFDVAGNSFASLGVNNSSLPWWGAKIKTTVNYAFNSTSMPVYLHTGALFDLCGTVQSVGNIETTKAGSAGVTNSSDSVATLYNNQTENWTHVSPFDGKINLVKTGAGVHTFNLPCHVTGDIDLQGGGLAFGVGGCWSGAKTVKLAAGTSISIADDNALGSDPDLVTTGGILTFTGTSVAQTARTFKIGSEFAKAGDYSADGRAGTTKCDYLSGDGVLTVQYSGVAEVVDGCLTIAAGETLELSATVLCDSFTNVVVESDATLRIADTSKFKAGSDYRFNLASADVLEINANVGVPTAELKVGGQVEGAGRHVFGSGFIYVPYGQIEGTDVAWTAQGTDSLMTTAENWSEAVDLTDGSVRAIFSAGSAATVVGSQFLNGLVFNQGSAFAVDAADSRAQLRLASGGVSTTGGGTFTVSAPALIEGDQTWEIATPLTVSGAINSESPSNYTIHKTGNGRLTVSGTGNYTGSFYLDGGDLYLKGQRPLGGASLDGSSAISVNSPKTIYLDNAVVEKPVQIDLQSDFGNSTPLIYAQAGTNVFTEQLLGKNGNFIMHNVKDVHARLVFAGGFVADRAYVLYACTGSDAGLSELVVTNKPMVCSHWFRTTVWALNSRGVGGVVVFAVPGNSFGSVGANDSSQYWSACDVKTTVDWAFDNDMPMFIGGNSVWDLCGTHQRIGLLKMCGASNASATITNTSADPATLEFCQSADWTNRGLFAGNLNVVMAGTKTLTINSPMASTGSVEVKDGTMAFTGDGTWRTASEIIVSGSGRITAESSKVFGKKSVLRLASTNSLSLSAGCVARVGKLVIGETEYTSGVFDFGAGQIFVGDSGLMIMLR